MTTTPQTKLFIIFTVFLILLKFNIMKEIDAFDKTMFKLFDILKSKGLLKYKRDFANACGLPEQNLYNISKGRNHFTINHVANVCLFYSINANWIIGTEENLFIKPTKSSTQTVHKTTLKEAI